MKQKIVLASIISFLIGGLVFGSIGIVIATVYNASDITYTPIDNTWNVSNVQSAIDDLDDKVNKNFTGNFYISGYASDAKSRYSKFEINVKHYKYIEFDITNGWPHACTANIKGDGNVLKTLSTTEKSEKFKLNISNYNVVEVYYYQNAGYAPIYGTYTLSNK